MTRSIPKTFILKPGKKGSESPQDDFPPERRFQLQKIREVLFGLQQKGYDLDFVYTPTGKVLYVTRGGR